MTADLRRTAAAATSLIIERARPDDLPAVRRLLEANRLPTDGIDAHMDTAIVARTGRDVVGCAALERHADGVLLRSVAVAPARQRQGLGHQLVAAALDLAQTVGAPAVYLLTTSAAAYFPRFGFSHVARAAVPASVRTSIEFTSACPSNAVAMRRPLPRPALDPAQPD